MGRSLTAALRSAPSEISAVPRRKQQLLPTQGHAATLGNKLESKIAVGLATYCNCQAKQLHGNALRLEGFAELQVILHRPRPAFKRAPGSV